MTHRSHHSHHSLGVERDPYRLNLPQPVELLGGSPYAKSLVRLVRMVRNGTSEPEEEGTITWPCTVV